MAVLSNTLRALRSQSITLLLCVVVLVMLLAATWVGSRLTSRYETFVGAFQQEQTAELVQVAVADLLWNRYVGVGGDLAQSASSNGDLAKSVAAKDAAGIAAVLGDEFNQGLVTEGRVKLFGFTVYDTSGSALASSWAPLTDELRVPADVIARASGREGSERLQLLSTAWTAEGRPILTVFAPVGGLRLRGYLAVHLDPLHALQPLDSKMGMQVELRQTGAETSLLRLQNVALENDAKTNSFQVPLETPEGAPLLDIVLLADVSELDAQLSATRLEFLLLFLAVGGSAGLAGVAVVSVALHRSRRREAAILTEARFRVP